MRTLAKSFILLLFLIASSQIQAFSKVKKEYRIAYGSPDSSIHITEFFSFSCPMCQMLFRKDFEDIRRRYLYGEASEIYWEFNPIPVDPVTVQAMVCLSQLDEDQKRIFLESILLEGEASNPGLNSLLMEKAMEFFQKPIPKLREMAFLEKTQAFQDAFEYLKNENLVSEVPTVEVNGRVYLEPPTIGFISNLLKK